MWLETIEKLEVEALNVFNLKGANGEGTPLSRYDKLTVMVLDLKLLRVIFFITKNPGEVLDPKDKNRRCKIVVWNIVKLAYQEHH